MAGTLNEVANDGQITGFGAHSAKEVEELQKALGLGGPGGTGGPYGNNVDDGSSYANQLPGAFRDGNALAVEDLDRTLKLVTHGLEHLRLWKDIIKERVPQVVHEYNIQNSYGAEVPVFFQMGTTPVNTDAQYNRDVIQVKYLGTQGAVLHNLTLIQAAHGPVVAREVKNKTIELLSRNERAMFFADEGIHNLEYTGIDMQIRNKEEESQYNSASFSGYGNASDDTIIIDAEGADFDEDIAEDAALIAVNNFGMPMDMYLGTDIHSAFSRAFYAKQRTIPGETLTSGNRVAEHMGTLDFRFKPSLFNRPRKGHVVVNPIAAPTITNAGAGTGTEYAYALSAVSGLGEGEALVYVASADDVITPAAPTGLTAVTSVGVANVEQVVRYFNLYRTPAAASSAPGTITRDGNTGVAPSDYEFVRRIAATAATYSDDESISPGTGKAFLLMHDPDVLCWKQLGSMIKYDLAVTDTSYKWLQLLYGTPLIMAPKKNVIIDNLNSELANA